MCNTTFSSVISMGNSFSTLFSYFEISSMHKSKMAAIHIFENIAFFIEISFFLLFLRSRCVIPLLKV